MRMISDCSQQHEIATDLLACIQAYKVAELKRAFRYEQKQEITSDNMCSRYFVLMCNEVMMLTISCPQSHSNVYIFGLENTKTESSTQQIHDQTTAGNKE